MQVMLNEAKAKQHQKPLWSKKHFLRNLLGGANACISEGLPSLYRTRCLQASLVMAGDTQLISEVPLRCPSFCLHLSPGHCHSWGVSHTSTWQVSSQGTFCGSVGTRHVLLRYHTTESCDGSRAPLVVPLKVVLMEQLLFFCFSLSATPTPPPPHLNLL